MRHGAHCAGLVVVVASDHLATTPGAETWATHALDRLLGGLPYGTALLGRGVEPVEVWASERAHAHGHHRVEYRPSGLRWSSATGVTKWASPAPGPWQAALLVVKAAALRAAEGWCVDVWALCVPGDACSDPVLLLAEAHGLLVDRFYLPLRAGLGPRFLVPKNERSPALR